MKCFINPKQQNEERALSPAQMGNATRNHFGKMEGKMNAQS